MRTVAVLLFALAASGAIALAQKTAPPVIPVPDSEVPGLRIKGAAGDVAAQAALGFFYESRQDFSEAVTWFRKAADQGHLKAQNQLGLAYALGVGVEQDYEQAVFWYRKSAEQGDVKAQNNLGVMYDTGLGVEKDYVQAASWYRKAADQGDAFAENNLGLMYDNGNGVPQDYAQAMRWYRKAADQDDFYAMNNIGVLYAKGNGVPQEYVTAYFWYFIARERGQYDTQKEATKNRDEIVPKMTPGQVAEAEARAKEWLTDYQKRRGK